MTDKQLMAGIEELYNIVYQSEDCNDNIDICVGFTKRKDRFVPTVCVNGEMIDWYDNIQDAIEEYKDILQDFINEKEWEKERWNEF